MELPCIRSTPGRNRLLTEGMQLQFVANEVLYDLFKKAPCESKGLREMPMAEVSKLEEDGLSTRYHFRSVVDYCHFLLLRFITGKPNVALCQCCRMYFISKARKETLYCDRILKDGKACKKWEPPLKYKLAAQRDEVIKAFDQAKWKMCKRYERKEYGEVIREGLELRHILRMVGCGDQGLFGGKS